MSLDAEIREVVRDEMEWWNDCWACEGRGRVRDYSQESVVSKVCPECKGVGGELSEFGQSLKRFLKFLKEKGLEP